MQHTFSEFAYNVIVYLDLLINCIPFVGPILLGVYSSSRMSERLLQHRIWMQMQRRVDWNVLQYA